MPVVGGVSSPVLRFRTASATGRGAILRTHDARRRTGTTGTPSRIEDLELAEPGPGEVRVRMLASGVCHSDLHVRDGEWERPGPIVLGHEGAGVVETLGPGVDGLSIGQPVALSWLVPCGVCRACASGRPWACPNSPSFRHRMPDGGARWRRSTGEDVLTYCAIGTLAEAEVVPAAAAIPIPEGVDPAAAALIGCCVATGVGAVTKTAAVPEGASVAVIGLGGVGLSCVMGAVLAGAGQVVAIDRVASKLAAATSVGATATILAGEAASTLEQLRDLTDGGPDFVFEAIGRRETIELAIQALPLGGTAVLVGMTPFGVEASFEVYPFVDGSRRILGSNYGFAEPSIDFPRYAQLHLDGRLPIDRLVDRRIGLDQLEDAFDGLREGAYTRQVVVFE